MQTIVDKLKNLSQSGDRFTIDDVATIEHYKGDCTFFLTPKDILHIGEEIFYLFKMIHRESRDTDLFVLKEFENQYDFKLFYKNEHISSEVRSIFKEENPWLFDGDNYIEKFGHHDRKQRVEMGKDLEGRDISLVEYFTTKDILNYEILVIETGGLNSDHGGWVDFYEGRLIGERDIE